MDHHSFIKSSNLWQLCSITLSCQTENVVHLDVSLHPPLTVSLALVQPTSARKASVENPSKQRCGGRLIKIPHRRIFDKHKEVHLQLEGTMLKFSQKWQIQLCKGINSSLKEGGCVASREHKEENDKEVEEKQPAQQPLNSLSRTRPRLQPGREWCHHLAEE